MTDVTITPVRDIPGATEETVASFQATAMRSETEPAIRVDGAEVTFPSVITALYRAGEWTPQPALSPLPANCHWRVILQDKTNGRQLVRTVILPVGNSTPTFGQLVDVQPDSGATDPDVPLWQAILDGITEQTTTAVDAAVTADAAKDIALAESASAGGSAFNAGASAATALGHKNDAAAAAGTATTKAGEAAASAAAVKRGEPNGTAALNSAGKALQADGKVLLDVDTANTSYGTVTPGPGAAALRARQTVNVADYANVTTGYVDQDSFSAAAAVAGAGGTLFLPRRALYRITAAIPTLTDVNLTSDGAQVFVTTDLGAGVYALTLNAGGAYPITFAENFELIGPNVSTASGVAPNQMHGIHLIGRSKTKFRHVQVRFFNRGVTLRTDYGHVYFDRVNFTANYYGLYLAKNSSDYFITDSELNGNKFAGIAMPADQGFDGFAFRNTHIGYQPYGVFQEALTEAGSSNQGSPKVFLQDGIFDHARFEQIGNGAIVSEATNDASNKSVTNAVKIIQPGFSWSTAGSSGTIPSRNRNYAIDVGYLDRELEIESGSHPFTTGDLGVVHIRQASSSAALTIRGSGATTSGIVIDSGAPSVTAGQVPVASVPQSGYSPGKYYSAPGARSASTRPNGFATFLPVRVEKPVTISGLAVEVTTAGNAGAVIRLGIYTTDSEGRASSLLVDAGTVAADTVGVKVITGLSLTVPVGWIHLAACVQSAATTQPAMRCASGVIAGAPMHSSGGQLASGAGWALSSAGQAGLPAGSGGIATTDLVVGVAFIAV